MNRRSRGRVLEASVKQSLVGNSFRKKTDVSRSLSSQNAAMNQNFCKPRTASAKLVKTNQSLYREKASITQFPAKKVLCCVKQHFPQNKLEDQTLPIIQYSKSFIEETSEKLDMVSKQIAELKKKLAEQHHQSSVAKAEEEKTKCFNEQRVFKQNFNQESKKMQKMDEYKIRIRLQSLQDKEKKEDKNVETVRNTYPKGLVSNATDFIPKSLSAESVKTKSEARKKKLKIFAKFIYSI